MTNYVYIKIFYIKIKENPQDRFCSILRILYITFQNLRQFCCQMGITTMKYRHKTLIFLYFICLMTSLSGTSHYPLTKVFSTVWSPIFQFTCEIFSHHYSVLVFISVPLFGMDNVPYFQGGQKNTFFYRILKKERFLLIWMTHKKYAYEFLSDYTTHELHSLSKQY